MTFIIRRTRFKFLALSFLILFQSCRVYKQTPVTLKEAVESKSRVRIKTLDDNKLKFKRVIIEDGNYYGIKKVKGHLEKVPILLNAIDTIRIHNKTMSIVYGSVIGVAIFFVTGFAIAITNWNPDFGGGLTFPN